MVLNVHESYNALRTAAYRLDMSDKGVPSPFILSDCVERPLTLPEVIQRAESNRN